MNGRFAISLHILTILEKFKGEVLSSEYIAGSVNINPVLIRKEISNLKKHGLIESKEGKAGGFFLAKPASQILLSDLYKAVRQVSPLGKAKNTPNPNCKIGKQINKHLNNLYAEAEAALEIKLGKTSLDDFSKQFS